MKLPAYPINKPIYSRSQSNLGGSPAPSTNPTAGDSLMRSTPQQRKLSGILKGYFVRPVTFLTSSLLVSFTPASSAVRPQRRCLIRGINVKRTSSQQTSWTGRSRCRRSRPMPMPGLRMRSSERKLEERARELVSGTGSAPLVLEAPCGNADVAEY